LGRQKERKKDLASRYEAKCTESLLGVDGAEPVVCGERSDVGGVLFRLVGFGFDRDLAEGEVWV
jgi:hypothetical protein